MKTTPKRALTKKQAEHRIYRLGWTRMPGGELWYNTNKSLWKATLAEACKVEYINYV